MIIAATGSSSRSRQGRLRLARRIWRPVAVLALALSVRRERRRLLGLDERMLKDMGLNRGEAYSESSRSFWDVPLDRLRR